MTYKISTLITVNLTPVEFISYLYEYRITLQKNTNSQYQVIKEIKMKPSVIMKHYTPFLLRLFQSYCVIITRYEPAHLKHS